MNSVKKVFEDLVKEVLNSNEHKDYAHQIGTINAVFDRFSIFNGLTVHVSCVGCHINNFWYVSSNGIRRIK